MELVFPRSPDFVIFGSCELHRYMHARHCLACDPYTPRHIFGSFLIVQWVYLTTKMIRRTEPVEVWNYGDCVGCRLFKRRLGIGMWAVFSPPHFVPMMWKRSERGYSNSTVQMKMKLTSVTVFAGATRGYLIGRGQVEARASGMVLYDDSITSGTV